MPKDIISKRSDSTARRLREARDGQEKGAVFCEGRKLIEEAARSGLKFRLLAVSAAFAKEAARFLRETNPAVPLAILSDDVMGFVSDLSTPPGWIALVTAPALPRPVATKDLILVLHRVQLPQNVGALFRTAEACAVSEVWTLPQTADPLGAKAVRGSAGSVFRIPFQRKSSLATAASELKAGGIAVLGAVQRGQVNYDDYDWQRPSALLVGSEGQGFSAEEEALFDRTVRIPMAGRVESLNAGVAAAVCLFEAARQRRGRT